MAKIPMGNFGNAMPQVGRIQMPQNQSGQMIAGAMQNISQAAQQIHEKEKLEQENKILLPKAEYTDKVLNSTDNYTFSEVAKELGFRSSISLHNKCRELGIIFKQGNVYLPYSKYSTQGYFATRTYPFLRRDGTSGSSSGLVITELGRAFLRKKLQK